MKDKEFLLIEYTSDTGAAIRKSMNSPGQSRNTGKRPFRRQEILPSPRVASSAVSQYEGPFAVSVEDSGSNGAKSVSMLAGNVFLQDADVTVAEWTATAPENSSYVVVTVTLGGGSGGETPTAEVDLQQTQPATYYNESANTLSFAVARVLVTQPQNQGADPTYEVLQLQYGDHYFFVSSDKFVAVDTDDETPSFLANKLIGDDIGVAVERMTGSEAKLKIKGIYTAGSGISADSLAQGVIALETTYNYRLTSFTKTSGSVNENYAVGSAFNITDFVFAVAYSDGTTVAGITHTNVKLTIFSSSTVHLNPVMGDQFANVTEFTPQTVLTADFNGLNLYAKFADTETDVLYLHLGTLAVGTGYTEPLPVLTGVCITSGEIRGYRYKRASGGTGAPDYMPTYNTDGVSSLSPQYLFQAGDTINFSNFVFYAQYNTGAATFNLTENSPGTRFFFLKEHDPETNTIISPPQKIYFSSGFTLTQLFSKYDWRRSNGLYGTSPGIFLEYTFGGVSVSTRIVPNGNNSYLYVDVRPITQNWNNFANNSSYIPAPAT